MIKTQTENILEIIRILEKLGKTEDIMYRSEIEQIVKSLCSSMRSEIYTIQNKIKEQ